MDRSHMVYNRDGKDISVHEIIIQAVSDWMRQESGDVVLQQDFTLVLVRRQGKLLVNARWDYWRASSLEPLPLPFTVTDQSEIVLEDDFRIEDWAKKLERTQVNSVPGRQSNGAWPPRSRKRCGGCGQLSLCPRHARRSGNHPDGTHAWRQAARWCPPARRKQSCLR